MSAWDETINNVKVNRTGKQIVVYATTEYQAPQIGTIYPNEVFSVGNILNEEMALYSIRFRNSAGQKTTGVIFAGHNSENVSPDLNIQNYAQFRKRMPDGINYYGYTLRRSEEVYNGSATFLRLIGQGQKVLADSSKSGVTHPEWMRIKYVETNVGTDDFVEIKDGEYVYMDIGYDKGSTLTSNCSLIGSL